MPSARAFLYTIAASGCIAANLPGADAFWLIPGSSRSHEDVVRSQPSQAQRLRDALEARYNAFTTGVADKIDSVTGSQPVETAKASWTETPSKVFDDLLLAFDEISSDVGYGATLAKETLSRGIYLKQNDETYMLAMDVPGLHTREVVVSAEKGTLRIKGERKCPNVVGTSKPDPLCIERYYDASFTFPSDADEERADAKLEAGVVRVFVPKVKGERRGFGRVLKLTEDAAGWVYEESGAKTVVDKTAEGARNAADSARNAYDAAAATAASAYGTATDAAQRMVDTVVGSAKDAANSAQQIAEDATATVKSASSKATDNVKATAKDAKKEAEKAAEKVKKEAAHASKVASKSAAHASKVASKNAAHATESVKSAANKATNAAAATATAATESVKSAASRATDAAADANDKGFVERIHDQYVKPIKDRMYSPGSSDGKIPVVSNDEL